MQKRKREKISSINKKVLDTHQMEKANDKRGHERIIREQTRREKKDEKGEKESPGH